MNNKPLIALLQIAPLYNEITMLFDDEHQFSEWFHQHEDIRWGTLLNRNNGSVSLSVSRSDDKIVIADAITERAETGLYIDRVETENTAGHIMIDFVFLKNGKVLGVTDESVVPYTRENVPSQNYFGIDVAGMIDLIVEPHGLIDTTDLEKTGIGRFIDNISTFIMPNEAGHTVLFDLVHLKDGRVLCVDNEGVILYEDGDLLHLDAIKNAGSIDLTVVPKKSSES
ncbi:MAG: hypothetical protein ACXV8S_12360 [Methylobacter sp.]